MITSFLQYALLRVTATCLKPKDGFMTHGCVFLKLHFRKILFGWLVAHSDSDEGHQRICILFYFFTLRATTETPLGICDASLTCFFFFKKKTETIRCSSTLELLVHPKTAAATPDHSSCAFLPAGSRCTTSEETSTFNLYQIHLSTKYTIL